MKDNEAQETVDMLKSKLSPERWVIKSTAFNLSSLEETSFYDLENGEWVGLAGDATKFKEPNIAQQILKQVCNGELAEIERYLQSPSEREPTEHKLASDWVTIAYNEGSENYRAHWADQSEMSGAHLTALGSEKRISSCATIRPI